MKIGIVGSRQYENRKKIKDTIFSLQKKFGTKLTIVSGGCKDGADRYAKKYALEFNCKYVEFNPAHTVYNFYSALNENYYGKAYSPRYFFIRNKMLAKYCDIVIGFIPKGIQSNGTNNTLSEAKKFNKKVVIIS
jgi:predicted Rossmann-fold nucleotide-binding protein